MLGTSLIFGSALLHVYTGGGILGGFLHPLLGIEHLLAMVAVGFLSAQLGGRAIWTIPVTFIAVMLVGAIIGMLGIDIPIIEYGITSSVLILGLGILANRGLPEWVAMVMVGIFALFHGFAHGEALPSVSSTIALVIAYVAGFLVSTAGLHVIGALIGIIAVRSKNGQLFMRVTGGIIAVIGILLIVRI